jgi:hypothetical protein
MDNRKKQVDREYTTRYTLDPAAFEKLIVDKIKRAKLYTVLLKKQQQQDQTLA